MTHAPAQRERPHGSGRSSALVESPLQVLCVLEACAAGLTDGSLHVRVRRDVPALTVAAADLRRLGVPEGVRWRTVSPPRALFAPGQTQVVGDAFSGLFQLSLLWRRPRRLVVVDDGLDTLELGRRLTTPGQALVRVRATAGRSRTLLGTLTTARLRRWARAGRVTLFTAIPLADDLAEKLTEIGVRVERNSFDWLRDQALPDPPPEPHVVIGSALVADGMIDEEPYVDWVRALAAGGPLRYLPHRRETPESLGRIAAVPGVVVDSPGAPVELRLGGVTPRHRITTLPSTSAVLLTRIVGPRGTSVQPHDVPEEWWTPRATPELRRHLRRVLTLAADARKEVR